MDRLYYAPVLSAGLFLLTLAPTARAGDLAEGQILVGDQELGLSGTCARGLTHVDLTTGEQYPLTIRLGSAGATALANGDVLSWARIGTQLDFNRITPATGAHRIRSIDDNDFANPIAIVEDPTGNYVLLNDGALGRFELQTGIFEILASGSSLNDPTDLAVAANGDIFVADAGVSSILRFVPATGIEPYSIGGLLDDPQALDFAANGDLLVADGRRVLRIDAITQQQSIFNDAFVLPSGLPTDLTVNAAGDVFVLQSSARCDDDLFTSGIVRVPETVEPVPVLCASTQTDPVVSLAAISAVVGSNDLIVFGGHKNDGAGNASAVLRLDPSDASFDVISLQAASGAPAFGPDGSLYIAVDERDAVYEINPRTGLSRVVAEGGLLSDPRDLVVSDDGAFLFVLDNDGIVRVNPITGGQASVYDGAAFNDPTHIRIDRNGDFIVADLFSEELIFISSTDFSESTLSGGDLFRIVDVADPGTGNLIVADVGPNALISIDPGTGDQSLIGSAGYFSPASPAAILPEADGKILASVGGAGALGLVRIDPSDSSQEIVSDLPICIGADLEHVVVGPPPNLCGDPIDPPVLRGGERASGAGPAPVITASDALRVLRAGVGLDACELCVCDVNDSGTVTASDALIVLQFGVGGDVELTCPAC